MTPAEALASIPLIFLLVAACSLPTEPGCYERLPDGSFRFHPGIQSVRGWCPTIAELRVLGLFPPLK